MNNKVCNKIKANTNKDKDKVYTPENVVIDCLEIIKDKIKPTDHLFEPFYGKGAFYKHFPESNPKSYTEIDLDLDFFDVPDDIQTDYIITNPPYSIMTEIINKIIKMNNLKGFALLVNNLTMTPPRLIQLQENNFYPTELYIFRISKWFGICNFWFFEKRNNKPSTNITFKKGEYTLK